MWLSLRLWHNLPASILMKTPLLPSNCTELPPAGFFHARGPKQGAAVQAAAAFFTVERMRALSPLLLQSSHSRPRLHSLWPALLRLLVPAYDASADEVRPCPAQVPFSKFGWHRSEDAKDAYTRSQYIYEWLEWPCMPSCYAGLLSRPSARVILIMRRCCDNAPLGQCWLHAA